MKTINIGQVVNRIYKALPKDYDHFKIMRTNREINKRHISKLKESFSKQYIELPILVNDDYEIVDGQHRFTAACEKGLPIYYCMIKGLGMKQAILMNITNKNWEHNDYAQHYLKQNLPDYKKYDLFKREFGGNSGFKHSSMLMLLAGHDKDLGLLNSLFREGCIEINDFNQARILAREIMKCEDIYEGWNSQVFVRCMLHLLKYNEYDHKRFVNKLRQRPSELIRDLLIAGTNPKRVIRSIEEIYNYKSRKGDSIRLDILR